MHRKTNNNHKHNSIFVGHYHTHSKSSNISAKRYHARLSA